MVSPDLLAALRTQLIEGERVAWVQSPEPAAFESKPRRKGFWDGIVILGGGYATLGSIWMALRSSAWYWLAVPITIIVLGAAGYFAMQSRETRKLRALLGTLYAVTTRRVLILRIYPKRAVEALAIDAIADVALTNVRGDFADLSFVRKSEGPALTFPALVETKRAHAQVLRVVRDPKAVDAELAHSENYLKAMRGMVRGAS